MSIQIGTQVIPQIILGVNNLNKIMLGAIEIFPNLAQPVVTPISIFSVQPLAVDNVTTAFIPLNTTGLLIGDTVFVIRRSTISTGIAPVLTLNGVVFQNRLSQANQGNNAILTIDSYVVEAGVPDTGVVNIIASASVQLRADVIVARGGSSTGLTEMIGSAVGFNSPGPVMVVPTATDREALFIGAGQTAPTGTISGFTVTEPTAFDLGTPRVGLTGLGCILAVPQAVSITQSPSVAPTVLGGVWMRGVATAPPVNTWDPSDLFAANDDGLFYNLNASTSLMPAPFEANVGLIGGQVIGSAMNLAVANTPRKNLFQNTEQMSAGGGGSPWNYTGGGTFVLLPGQSPVPGYNAYQMTDGVGVSGDHRVNYAGFTFAANTWAISCYAKLAAGTRGFRIVTSNFNNFFADFNLQAGTFTNSAGVTAAMVDEGGGWWRCSISFTAVAQQSFIAFQIAAGQYVGDGSSIIIASPQLELINVSPYQPISFPLQQATVAARPAFNPVGSSMGGIFDGADDTLLSTASVSMPGNIRTIVWVGTKLNAGGPLFNVGFWLYGTGGQVDGSQDAYNSFGFGGGAQIKTPDVWPSPSSNIVIVTINPDAPSMVIEANGQENSNTSVQGGAPIASAPACIGAGQGFGPFGSCGTIAAFIINRELTRAEKDKFNTWAANLLGVSIP